jgi:hypothetical protein
VAGTTPRAAQLALAAGVARFVTAFECVTISRRGPRLKRGSVRPTAVTREYLKPLIVKCVRCAAENVFNQPYAYHAGFADQGFLYDDAGHLTLVWSCFDPAYVELVGPQNAWAR